MALAFYLDHQVPRAITLGLRLRGVDVLTAFEDGANTLPDSALLDRATTLGRVLFSQDTDLLIEAARRQATGQAFAGVIYAHPLRIAIGTCVEELALLAVAGDPTDLHNQVLFLPL
jgi:hypothetical protein